MGGQTFENTRSMTKEEYDDWLNNFKIKTSLIEGVDYVMPFRLKNKTKYSDVDFIVYDTDKFTDDIHKFTVTKEEKKIMLFEGRFNSYSIHVLTEDNIQIDLLRPWAKESCEITRIYYSYSCANIFLKKLVSAREGFVLSYLGLLCIDNKCVLPSDSSIVKIESTTRLITSPKLLFDIIDLDYDRFVAGFDDEYQLLEYFKTSKYYDKIHFINNSKFKHDCKRLESFNNLFIAGLLNM